MAVGYMNADELIQSIKVRAAVPISNITFSEDDLLRFAQEEIDLKLVPSILAVKEEFYVRDAELPLVANQDQYTIPYRAIGGKVRNAMFQQSSGTLIPLANIPLENRLEYQSNNFSFQYGGFYLEDDHLTMLPSVGGNPTGSLILKYYLRPNALVKMSRGARILTIDRTSGTISVAIGNTNTTQVPTNITLTSGIDFIKAKPSHKIYSFDITPVSISASTGYITFNTADIPDNLAVGDWICTAGETVIPQVPSELHVMLAQAVACRVLESLGDTQGLTNATAKLQEMEQKLLSVIDTRVESPHRKVISNGGLLMGARFNRWRRF